MGGAQAVVGAGSALLPPPPPPPVATALYTTNTAMASEFEVLRWPAVTLMRLWEASS